MIEAAAWLLLMLWLIPYVVYPLVVLGLAMFRKPAQQAVNQLPAIDVLIAARNEEQVLDQKLRSIFASNYPAHLIRVWVGSDASTDGTDALLEQWQLREPRLRAVRLPQRSGKSGVINALMPMGEAPVVVLTDANVFFLPDTLKRLVAPFEDPQVGLTGGRIIPLQKTAIGIAEAEMLYLGLENKLRWAESKVLGYPMAVEGGCFALRREAYVPIPARWLVEDFFLALEVYVQGYRGAFCPDAQCTEDVNPHEQDQFDRKVRIAQGDFQNLHRFGGRVWKRLPLALAFWCHKGLRWLAPLGTFFLIPLSAILAFSGHQWWAILLLIMLFLAMMVAIDLILQPQIRSLRPLRMVRHFAHMNLALFTGYFKYRNGVKTNVWEPTKRAN
jgi:cellulose synthase/poly-beta-1,6-N-acetylglucosamine synthase-like glycosyltransferase